MNFPDFEVEALDAEAWGNIAYRIRVKGEDFFLLRDHVCADRFLVIDETQKVCDINGRKWWTDRGGNVQPCG